MVKYIFTSILVLTTGLMAQAKVDRVHSESYLGEKRLDFYSDRYQPLIYQDIYQGKMAFEDEIFFQNFFSPYLFQKESEYSTFLRSELNGGLVCSNELLSNHFDEIRYSYRLITLSYLLEGSWHMKLASDHLKLRNGCTFNLSAWAKTCRPKSSDMKSFVNRLEKFSPKYDETLPVTYKKEDWMKEFKKNDFKWYSHYRMNLDCKGKCSDEEVATRFQKVCEADQKLMTLLCSEEDEVYGLSTNRDAYFLIGQSNIINTFNKQGEAMGCLRRFSEVMAHKEVRYEVLNQLFPSLQTFLRQKYQERFLQGRVFFYGAGKEFEEKGLTDVYVKEQPFKVEKLPTVAVEADAPKVAKTPEAKPEVKIEVKPEPAQPKAVVQEIRKPVKSAFLLAAEIRSGQNLEQVEVDMLKLKYDYVFSLNMINTLSERLKTFMTRDALAEMMAYDKLGSKEGPVPLMFIKYMIDMQEHHGLWNIISVLGDKFYVSNEIDSEFSPTPELVQIVNNQSTGNQWQLYIIKP